MESGVYGVPSLPGCIQTRIGGGGDGCIVRGVCVRVMRGVVTVSFVVCALGQCGVQCVVCSDLCGA